MFPFCSGQCLLGFTPEERGGGEGNLSVKSARPIHKNNAHYVTLTVDVPGKGVGLANDRFSRGICELRDDERTEWIHARFATSTDKPAFRLRLVIGSQLLSWRPHGDSNPGFESR